jgi:hypothetical protein
VTVIELMPLVELPLPNRRFPSMQNILASLINHRLQEMIDGFFTNWYATWAFAIGGVKGSPTFLSILEKYTNR